MHRKAIFFLAGVFLAVALIVPPVILLLQADKDLDNIIIAQNPTGMQTNGNMTITDQTRENHQNNLIIIAIIEVVFVVLFAITLYYGINHPHPEH